eukprot:2219622-Pyramimonas_sp.AAC.1
MARARGEALHLRSYAMEVIELQIKGGGRFALEQPATATSGALPSTQRLLELPGVTRTTFDMC